jgi:hypothetical protein
MLNLNRDTLFLMLKFGGGMLLILLLVWGIAVITPKLAKIIDRIFGLKPKEEQQVSPENYKVRDPWMGDLESPEIHKENDPEQESPQEDDLDKKDT